MIEKELIEEAYKKYPTNCKFISAYSGQERTYRGGNIYTDSWGDICVDDGNVIYRKGIWAEIVKYPENYVPPIENIINSFQLF